MLVRLWKKEALVHCWWECKYYYMIQESHFWVYIEVRWKENRISKRYLHALVRSIIHNNQDVGTTLVFINGWTDKEIWYTYIWILFSQEGNLAIWDNMNESLALYICISSLCLFNLYAVYIMQNARLDE